MALSDCEHSVGVVRALSQDRRRLRYGEGSPVQIEIALPRFAIVN